MSERRTDEGAPERRTSKKQRRPARAEDEPVLPERSRDEDDAGWGDTATDRDASLRDQVPPHH